MAPALLPLAWLLTAAPAPAQEAPEQPLPEHTTVVTGSRAPERLEDSAVAVEVLTRRELKASGATTVADALSAQPGVEVRQGISGSELWLSGLGPKYTLVLVDGERVTGRLGGGGGFDLARIPVDEVEQVELVRGPASVLHGADAVAGVVHIITRRAQRTLGVDLRANAGTLRHLDLHAGADVRRESFRIRAGVDALRRDHFDLGPDDPATTGSGREDGSLFLRAEVTPSDALTLSLNAQAGRQTQRGVDLSSSGALFDRAMQNDSADATFEAKLQSESAGDFTLSLRAAQLGHRYLSDQRGASALDQFQQAKERQARLGLNWTHAPLAGHRLVIGTEALGEALTSDRLGPEGGQRARFSAFAEDTYSPTFNLPFPIQLVAGARFDHDTLFGPAFTPRGALRLDPHESLTLRAQYGLAFRAPSFSEQFIAFENPSVGYVVEGNPSLRPERARGGGLSFEWRPTFTSGLLIWGQVHRNDLRDMISAQPLPASEGLRFSYANVARARVQGGELGVGQRFAFGLGLRAAYTFTDARDLELDRQVEAQARHRATFRADYRYRPWRLDAGLQAALTGPRPFYADGDSLLGQDHVAPAFVTLDANVGHQLSRVLRVEVTVRNLLDEGDASYLPLPPRTLLAGLSAQL